jgi:hypothetical protein
MSVDDSLVELQAKMNRLEDFVLRLRKIAAVPGASPVLNRVNIEMNLLLADCVERLLRIGSSEEISQCYDMCQEKMAEV